MKITQIVTETKLEYDLVLEALNTMFPPRNDGNFHQGWTKRDRFGSRSLEYGWGLDRGHYAHDDGEHITITNDEFGLDRKQFLLIVNVLRVASNSSRNK